MKPRNVLLWLLAAFVVCLAFGAWTTHDYGLQCTKCLADKYVVEEHLFGFTVFRGTKDRYTGADYERIFGQPCEHTFHRGGYGRRHHNLFYSTIGCGVHGEGLYFQSRLLAASAAYDVENRLHDRELTLATFQLIDTLVPADPPMKDRRLTSKNEHIHLTTFRLWTHLQQAKTVEEWRNVLDAARHNFADTSQFPLE